MSGSRAATMHKVVTVAVDASGSIMMKRLLRWQLSYTNNCDDKKLLQDFILFFLTCTKSTGLIHT